jgi:hypothetical protein
VRIRDLGWKKVGSGIRDKHHGSATLHLLVIVLTFGILHPVVIFLHLLDVIITYLVIGAGYLAR